MGVVLLAKAVQTEADAGVIGARLASNAPGHRLTFPPLRLVDRPTTGSTRQCAGQGTPDAAMCKGTWQGMTLPSTFYNDGYFRKPWHAGNSNGAVRKKIRQPERAS